MGSDVGTGRTRAVAVILPVILCLLAVGAVLIAGPVRIGAPPWIPPTERPAHIAPTAAPHASAPVNPQQTHSSVVATVAPKVLIILAIIAALLIAYLVWRRLRGRGLRVTHETASGAVAFAETPAEEELEESDPAPAVARGIARALELVDEPREPGDAIVAAWLGLQEAAADSGVRRRPSETPAEYTARIISRIGADDAAATRLLRLYQGVRFGAHPATATDVDTARACLLALRASWHSVGTEGLR
ncbi:DUF4129 domain-containing protein [Rathayibacter sp. CAU 1779]